MRLIVIFLCFITSGCSHYKSSNFSQKINKIEKDSYSVIGVSAVHIESGKRFDYRSSERFPMASTVKLPIAITLLKKVENGELSLDKMVDIRQRDFVPYCGYLGYYLYHDGLSMSLYNMLESMLIISENTSSDKILSVIGGPKAVYSFLKKNQILDISINRSLIDQFIAFKGAKDYMPKKSERTVRNIISTFNNMDKYEMAKSYAKFFADTKDTTTPYAMTTLLEKLFNNKLLNKKNTDLLIGIMQNCEHDRIKTYLPKDVLVAHKTGSWGSVQLDAAYNYTNDVGIITLPNNAGHIAISVYTGSKDKKSSNLVQKEAIGKISKIIYDEFK